MKPIDDILATFVHPHMIESIRAMIKKEPDFASFLLRQKPSYLQYLALLYAVDELQPTFKNAEIASDLMGNKTSAMLHQYVSDQPGVTNLPKKLEAHLFSNAVYKFILGLLKDEKKAPILLGLHSISKNSLLAFQQWPQELLHKRILSKLKTYEQVERVIYLWGIFSKKRPDELDGLVDTLMTCKSLDQGFITLWERYVAGSKSMPIPFAVGDEFRLITTSDDLKETAQRYNNCLKRYSHEILTGKMFFLEWLGMEPAIVEIADQGSLGLFIKMIKGHKNTTPSADTLADIRHLLLQCGVFSEIPQAFNYLEGSPFDDDIPF